MRKILQLPSQYPQLATSKMDQSKGQGTYQSQALPGRRSREERRSLSETLADGTSKFFSSMVAKKNGLFSDITSKIENTFAPKTDTISNSTGSDASGSPPTTPPVPNTPPPRPPPPKRLPSMGSSQEKTAVMKRMSSMPAYSRTESKSENEFGPQAGRGSKDDSNKYNIGGMNVSFDQPIYTQQSDLNQRPVVDNKARGVAATIDNRSTPPTATSKPKDLEGAPRNNRHAANVSNTQNTVITSVTTNTRAPNHSTSTGSTPPSSNNTFSTEYSPSSKSQPTPAPRRAKSPGNSTSTVSNSQSPPTTAVSQKEEQLTPEDVNERNFRRDQNKSSSSEEWSDRRQTSEDSNRSYHNERSPDSSGSSVGKTQGHRKNPKLTTARRSSTVDEMLFDDYVDPEVDTVICRAETPPENLISFEPELEVSRSDSSGTDGGNSRGMAPGRSIDSSDVEYGGTVVPRSMSMGSDKSWSSSYSVDSQPDDLTLECMEFMKSFVDKVFLNSEEISQTDKAKFGELCQHFPGRLWFSRYVNSQRVHNKCVNESIFFRLMQYFAVCLFECNEAEDYSPAKTLMNMCFTFFHEAPSPGGGSQSPNGGAQNEKVFLYTYMRDQPIWQSLRFWNAAFFDAVQCERSRRPMPTNSAENQTVTDDRKFQENITFGQLGTFACNMRSFGLSKELCLEFLRKQSTIANLRQDQVKLLRDNIERVREN